MRLALVVVFLNEERHLGTLLGSIASQSRPPDHLLLVDDGSTDRSAVLAEEFAGRHPYARLLRRPAQPASRDRLVTASVWTSFQWAVAQLGEPCDVVAKLDADIRLTPGLLAEVEARFEADEKLGLTGPYLSEPRAEGAPVRLRSRPEHVAGATKFYRRACYDDVYPLPPLLNLDIMDEVKARGEGWRVASFQAREGDPLHLRPMGGHDGRLRALRRWGEGDYASGTHPLFLAYVGLQRMGQRPYVLAGLNYLGGWALAAARRRPRFDPGLLALRRQEQLQRVRRRLAGMVRGFGGGRSRPPSRHPRR
jgi:glycosyltransferase involved in cell wall biosynthesis